MGCFLYLEKKKKNAITAFVWLENLDFKGILFLA